MSPASSPSSAERLGKFDAAVNRGEAAEWVIRLHEASSEQRPALKLEFEHWQAQHPDREHLYLQMQQMWAALEPGQNKPRKRQFASALVVLIAACLFAVQIPWSYWTADQRTATGDVQRISLPDGSTVVLNSNSAINVNYSDGQRSIRLARGEILVNVEHEPAGRPFTVYSRDGAATALGTRYSVRLFDHHTTVAVQESAVQLIPNDAPAAAVELSAGQQARLTPDGVSTAQETPAAQTFSWVNQRLVFHDAGLEDVVRKLARYHRGVITLDDDLRHKRLHFTGVIPTNDTPAALAILADSLSLQVRQLSPYIVWLEAQP